MRRILLSCALLTVFSAAAVAAAHASASAKPGYLVVQKGRNDGGVKGNPAVTVVVRPGFILGRVSKEAAVEIYHLASASGQGAPQVEGTDVFTAPVRWHGLSGKRYSGSSFRFRAPGGFYRVVIRGSGVYVFAGGRGTAWLQGTSTSRHSDGTYSVNGGRFRSLPTNLVKRKIGGG